jgi:hypothetical protein
MLNVNILFHFVCSVFVRVLTCVVVVVLRCRAIHFTFVDRLYAVSN